MQGGIKLGMPVFDQTLCSLSADKKYLWHSIGVHLHML